MYFWNIEKLKEDIRAGQLTERNRFYYALIFILSSAIGAEFGVFFPIENTNTFDHINSSFYIAITLVGTIATYKLNGANEGKDFLGKYFSISFVVGIRCLGYAILFLFAPYFYYYSVVNTSESVDTGYIETIPFLIWYAAMYWRICVHIKQLKQ